MAQKPPACLSFWELRRAVTVATKETTVADGGFFAPFRLSRRQSSQRISFMLRKELYLLVICVNYFIGRAARCSPLTRRFIALVWFATLSLELISGGDVLAANVPPGSSETVISGPQRTAGGTTFENTGSKHVWEGAGQVGFKDLGALNY